MNENDKIIYFIQYKHNKKGVTHNPFPVNKLVQKMIKHVWLLTQNSTFDTKHGFWHLKMKLAFQEHLNI